MYDIKDFLVSYTNNKWHSIVLAMFIIVVMICIWIFFPKKQVIYKADVEIDKLLNDYSDTLKDEIMAQIGDELVIPIYGDVQNSANKKANVKLSNNKFPNVVNFINDTGKQITYAGIIVLQPKFFQIKHIGYAPNANSTLRYYYPICHSSVDRSGLWIDGEKKSFYKGTTICADISYESSLFNACERRKTVLLFFDVVTKKKGISNNNIIEKDDILFQFLNACEYVNRKKDENTNLQPTKSPMTNANSPMTNANSTTTNANSTTTSPTTSTNPTTTSTDKSNN